MSEQYKLFDVNELYEKVAKYHNTTVEEVLRRTTQHGEPLINQYYKAKT